MNLSGALSNAMSGLTANARGTVVVSSNIANALNENYGRRDIELGTNATQSSGGVTVTAISRQANPILAHQTRLATSGYAQSEALAQFATNLEQLWGSVDTIGSVAEQLTKFEAALVSAAADPSSDTRLRNLAYTAESFATSIRSASDGLQDLRSRADAEIATAVDDLNAGLKSIETLNQQIMTAKHLGQDTLSLLDQRDGVLSGIAEYVPVHVIDREDGAVALFSSKGRTLVDGRAIQISFKATPTVLAHMTVGNGLLSEMEVDGAPTSAATGAALSGGKLEALFQIRDDASVNAQSRLDGIARDIIDRFGASGPDATITAGGAGLFTDNGSAFLPANETGIAGRISLNSTLNADATDIWKWRTGVNATAPGDVGDSTLLVALQNQISASLTPNSVALGTASQSLANHILDMTTDVGSDRVRLTASKDSADAILTNFKQMQASDGVNTDQELQKLIELEKAYAANARVVQVVDDMLSELLSI